MNLSRERSVKKKAGKEAEKGAKRELGRVTGGPLVPPKKYISLN